MNKAVLAEELAARLLMPQREARIAVQTIFDAMIAALVRGEKIELRGFPRPPAEVQGWIQPEN